MCRCIKSKNFRAIGWLKRTGSLSLFLCLAIANLFAQDRKERKTRPDIPGVFLVEIGVNSAQGASKNFNTAFWGSRTVNVYYQYDLQIPGLASRFTLSPGLGLGMERFKFKNNYTLAFDGSGDLVMEKSDFDVRKSQLITNYLDIPIEIKYTHNPSNPYHSFRVSAGFRGGMLISSFTKLKYDDDDNETIKEKTRRDWNLNKFRYGVYGKIGVGNVSLFGYYNLSPLFKKGSAPDNKDINTMTFGISLGGF